MSSKRKIFTLKLIILSVLLNESIYSIYNIMNIPVIKNYYYYACLSTVILEVLYLLFNISRTKYIHKRDATLLSFCIGLFLIVQVYSSYLGNIYNISVITRICIWPLLYFCFYTGNPKIDELKSFRNSIIISYIILVLTSIPAIILHLSGHGRIGAVIFSTYPVITATPLLLLVLDVKYRYKIMVFVIILMGITTKRTGVIAAVGGLIIFYLVESVLQNNFKRKLYRLIKMLLIILSVIVFIFIVNQYFHLGIIERFSEISSDRGSGRSDIWEMVIQSYKAGSPLNQLIGKGYEGVSRFVRPQNRSISAHNDFIEVLYDFGRIGFVILIFIYVFMIKICINMIRKKYIRAPLFCLVVGEMFVLSMFSYLFIQSFIIQNFMIYIGIELRYYYSWRKNDKFRQKSINSYTGI